MMISSCYFKTKQLISSSSLHSAALSIVKEVANHANDIMKQGVRPDCTVWKLLGCIFALLLTSSVFALCFLGQLPEADAHPVQPHWSPWDCATWQGELHGNTNKNRLMKLCEIMKWIKCSSWLGAGVVQVFLKQGTLMKLSRKVMQPRMFFLVSIWNPICVAVTSLSPGADLI